MFLPRCQTMLEYNAMKKKKGFEFPPGTITPSHIAIIPDGNRRWARAKKLPTLEGHRRGFNVALDLARACRDFGVHTLSFWAFSTDNWTRSKEEITYLMKLYEMMIDRVLKEAFKDKVRIIHLGRKDRIPRKLAEKIEKAEIKTKDLKKYIFNLALDYGGKDEILRAIKRIQDREYRIQGLNEENFNDFLDTVGQPYPCPDLLIRTSGEQRTSGLLPWQMAYTEFYFVKKHFPDMTKQDIYEAILEYNRRERRFGGDSKNA